MGSRDSRHNRTKRRLKPISLHPLSPEQALKGLLQVQPEQKEAPAEEQRESKAEAEKDEA